MIVLKEWHAARAACISTSCDELTTLYVPHAWHGTGDDRDKELIAFL
jgi:hypothetical protein